MDSFLQKFSLQSLLRQFFCGVVFFAPLWLFSKDLRGEYDIGSLVDITEWKTGTFLLFAALSSVIGTIIYHLEKNWYSYPLQLTYEYHHQGDRIKKIGALILTFVPLVGLCMVICSNRPFLWMALVLGDYMVLAVCLLLAGKERLIEPTLKQWLWEEKIGQLKKDAVLPIHSEDDLLKVAAMKKISTWSDFIHCVQSCCFAWIFGSLLVYYISGTIESGFYLGLTVAFLLLAAEMIIDMHRYRFVKELSAQWDDANSSSDNRNDNEFIVKLLYEHPISHKEDVQVLYTSEEKSVVSPSVDLEPHEAPNSMRKMTFSNFKEIVDIMNLISSLVRIIMKK